MGVSTSSRGKKYSPPSHQARNFSGMYESMQKGGDNLYIVFPGAKLTSIHARIPSLTLRYPSRISSSLPGARCGSGEPVVDCFLRGRYDWADCMDIVAERDGEIERDAIKGTERLGPVTGYVDADLLHYGNCTGRYPARRVDAGREGFIPVAVFCPEIPLRHLRPGRVCGADKENAGLICHAHRPPRNPRRHQSRLRLSRNRLLRHIHPRHGWAA